MPENFKLFLLAKILKIKIEMAWLPGAAISYPGSLERYKWAMLLDHQKNYSTNFGWHQVFVFIFFPKFCL